MKIYVLAALILKTLHYFFIFGLNVKTYRAYRVLFLFKLSANIINKYIYIYIYLSIFIYIYIYYLYLYLFIFIFLIF